MGAGNNYRVEISDRCIQCGMCAEYCGFGVLVLVENFIQVRPTGCSGCGACAEVCPEQAIRIVPVEPSQRQEAGVAVPLTDLREFVMAVLLRIGVPEDEASIVTASLLEADLRGTSSHGVARLAGYIKRIRLGLMQAATDFKVEKQSGVVVVCDAGNGWGQVAGLRAMELCIKSAKRYGVGVATVKRSNHFGRASFYTLAASRAGLIGLVMSNTGPSMAAWGGKTPVLGTNPISVAAPAPWGEFCLDMALTTVAKSRIRLAGKEGHEIPPTWALDEFGRPTTDPTIALKGTLQPAGGAKGYAAALLVDLLSGVLSGGAYATDVRGSMDSSGLANVGQFVAALDPVFFLGSEEWEQRLTDWAAKIKVDQGDVRIPGERAEAARSRNAVHGISIGPKTRDELSLLATELGLTVPWK
jgi:LDH2 family malate/lactate/ureidoglycolate dehydrogenase/NAD-dependent dihydropyrimidine dehydrogenase PreA subunit